MNETKLYEQIVRILTASNPIAPDNILNYSYARKEYMKSHFTQNVKFHVILDGCFLLKSDEDLIQNHKSFDKQSQATQTVFKYNKQVTIQTDQIQYSKADGFVSKSYLYDLYYKTKQQKITDKQIITDFDKEVELFQAIVLVERLVAQHIGYKTITEYIMWQGSLKEPSRLLYSISSVKQKVSCIRFHPTHNDIFAVSYGNRNQHPSNSVSCFEIYSVNNIFNYIYRAETTTDVMCMAWSPFQYNLLVVGFLNGHVALYQVDQFVQVLQRIPAHDEFITSISFKSDRNQFVTTSLDGTYKLFEIKQNSLRIIHKADVYDNGCENDLYAKQDTIKTSPSALGVTCSKFCPKTQTSFLLILGTDSGVLRILSSSLYLSVIQTFTQHDMAIYAVDFNPSNSDILVSASEDFTVKLWKKKVSDPLVTFDIGEPVIFCKFCEIKPTVLICVTLSGKVFIYDFSVNIESFVVFFDLKVQVSTVEISAEFLILAIGEVGGKISIYKLSQWWWGIELRKLEGEAKDDRNRHDVQSFVDAYSKGGN